MKPPALTSDERNYLKTAISYFKAGVSISGVNSSIDAILNAL